MSLNSFAPLRTLIRKIRKSFAQRGIFATAKRFVTKPCEVVHTCFREMSPAFRRCRALEREFDRRMRVETCAGTDLGWMARIHSENWIYGIGYAPVPIRNGTSILAGLGIHYEEYTFIDFGAGKGRMLFLSSEFPFRRIIGVEYAPDLYTVLRSNLASYQNPAQRCFDLQGLLQDAVQYELPNEPLVLFFHHPFDETVFRQVLTCIERSLEQSPRDIRVIYYDPACGQLFEQSPYFRQLQHGKWDRTIPHASAWTVYGSLCTKNG